MSRRIQARQFVPEDILSDMYQILDYLWDDERHDYLARDEQDRKGHIFEAVRNVRSWFDSTT